MEKTNTVLADGLNHVIDRLAAVNKIITALDRYRMLLEITTLTHEHMATFDEMDHQKMNEIVITYLKSIDLETLKQEWAIQ